MKGRILIDRIGPRQAVLVPAAAALCAALKRAYGEDSQIVVLVPRTPYEWMKAEKTSRYLHNPRRAS